MWFATHEKTSLSYVLGCFYTEINNNAGSEALCSHLFWKPIRAY